MKISLLLISVISVAFFIGCSQEKTLTSPGRVESRVLKDSQNKNAGQTKDTLNTKQAEDTLNANDNLNAGMISIGYKPGQPIAISMVNSDSNDNK